GDRHSERKSLPFWSKLSRIPPSFSSRSNLCSALWCREATSTKLFLSVRARRPSSYALPRAASPPPAAYSRKNEAYSSSSLACAFGLPVAIFMPEFLSIARLTPARRRFQSDIARESCLRLAVDSPKWKDSP